MHCACIALLGSLAARWLRADVGEMEHLRRLALASKPGPALKWLVVMDVGSPSPQDYSPGNPSGSEAVYGVTTRSGLRRAGSAGGSGTRAVSASPDSGAADYLCKGLHSLTRLAVGTCGHVYLGRCALAGMMYRLHVRSKAQISRCPSCPTRVPVCCCAVPFLGHSVARRPLCQVMHGG